MNLKYQEFSFLNRLRDECAEYAKQSGFRAQANNGVSPLDQDRVNAALFVANQHSEASEFWEAFRAGKLRERCDKTERMQALGIPVITCAEEEIADQIIRLLDTADYFGVDVAKAVYAKMLYNRSRERLHGGKKA